MSQKSNEKFIIFVTTLASAGLIIEIFLMKWEFWVPPIVLAGVIALWAINLSDRVDYGIRKIFYFGFAALLVFYHGIHSTSLFDIIATSALVMVTYSVLNDVYMMNFLLAEFFALWFIHLINLPGGERFEINRLNVSRALLHLVIELLVYYISIRSINERIDDAEENQLRAEQIEANDESMEDFLSNISHELRTPVNVVNGMSDLLIRKNGGNEAESIKKAGVRLAYQIEDIQDYTECKRKKIFLEEDDYMSTSLINDVVTNFRLSDKAEGLDLVVDLDPNVPTMMRGDIKKLHKIFRHLLENAVKFTRTGGIYVRMYAENTDYGVNLGIEMTDTGIGMDRSARRAVAEGMYQENKKRNRSSGGIGLGLSIVYGFAHRMGGFVKIESEKGNGTTVRVTIPQKVVDKKPCISLQDSFDGAVLFHVRPDKYRVPKLRDFYRNMASNLAMGIHVKLYPADTVYEVERLKEKLNVTHVFMGEEEYEENRGYFDALAGEDIIVAVASDPGFSVSKNSAVVVMPKPLYAYPVIKLLNEGNDLKDKDIYEDLDIAVEDQFDNGAKPDLTGVKALIVDDEPMNLIVASSLFRNYGMIIETAGSGKESIKKFRENDYDVIFMDHMMPEMDGVEAMKQIKAAASDLDKKIKIVALTANAVSGAREMFIREGFDGFIAKPINISDFERVMFRVLSGSAAGRGGEKA
ncbi:MAG: response regulator [Lachnospiraceae bacterium]|nr:response regulator [Lachnospiraceae bacterium]